MSEPDSNILSHHIQFESYIMSSQKKGSGLRQPSKESHRVQGNYTEDGFYRKIQHRPHPGLSNIAQKESVYDNKTYTQGMHPASDNIGYTTLNPSKFEASASDPIQEQEYEIVAVFQLNREKEKNRILEKRLMNKEIHIAKMTEVQIDLTQAFQKCQAELEFYKRKCAQPVDEREANEQVAQLKHLVIRLEDKITEYEKKENRRYNSVRAQEQGGYHSHDRNNLRDAKANGNDSDRHHKIKDKRSKTVANQLESSPQFKKLDIIQDYVTKYPTRITNFISQFLAMVECFSRQAQQADRNNVKRRMKIGWKWIKEVVIEWNQLNNYSEKAKYFHGKLKKIFNIPDGLEDEEIMETIITAIEN